MNELELLNFPTSESGKRQLGYVSEDFYETSYIGKWLFQVMGLEYDNARNIVEEFPWQMFPETATWGLKYHEVKWQLPVREDLPYEERRRRIFQRRDLKSPMTPYRMEQYLANATGFETIVSDVQDPGEYGFSPKHPNIFKVTFIGEGTVDTGVMKELIDNLKQSHTTYLMSHRLIILADHRNMETWIVKRAIFHMFSRFFQNHDQNGEVFQTLHTRNRYHGIEIENKEAILVSSRGVILLNHCGMESFIVEKFIQQMSNPFFRNYGLDGTPVQRMSARNLYQGIRAQNKESVQAGHSMRISVNHRDMERFKTDKLTQRMVFPFFQDYSPKGAPVQEMHTRNRYQGYRAETKETIGISLVKKKNMWRLNGAVPLNGSRNLNAKLTEEVL